jgi:hypothetical protein
MLSRFYKTINMYVYVQLVSYPMDLEGVRRTTFGMRTVRSGEFKPKIKRFRWMYFGMWTVMLVAGAYLTDALGMI